MAKKKKTSRCPNKELAGVGQDLKFLGFLTLGFSLSVFLIVSGLASIYPSVRQTAQKNQIPFILVGEPEEAKRPENLEQIRARIFSKREEDLRVADLNNDGIVNIADYLMAKRTLRQNQDKNEKN